MPDGARLVATERVPWPTVLMKNVWILPGVPEIFAMKMPQIRAELAGEAAFVSHAAYTSLDEGTLKPLIDRVVASFADVDVGSYPKWRADDYQTKITFDALDPARCLAARDAFSASLPEGALVRLD